MAQNETPVAQIQGDLFIRASNGVEIPLGAVNIPIHLDINLRVQ